PALSLTGLVFGMQATAVKPPATAAAVPVATVSLCSCPGSRRCTCMSIRPGQTTRPAGTSTSLTSASTSRSRPTRVMRVPSMSTSNTPSRPFAGSTTCPPLSSHFDIYAPEYLSDTASIDIDAAGEQVQHGHADRHAVGDLLENHRIRAVGDVRGDLDAAVHRPGMHDDDVRLR